MTRIGCSSAGEARAAPVCFLFLVHLVIPDHLAYLVHAASSARYTTMRLLLEEYSRRVGAMLFESDIQD
jgi:hypothetical protein